MSEPARVLEGARVRVLELPGGRRIQTGKRPLVVGILNLTPDSFSDGGIYPDAQAAVDGGLRMLEEGADWLDLGGESTRPGSRPVPPEEQLRRVLPVLRALRARTGAPLSVDTMSPEVGERALEAGADILNDVNGFRDDAWRRIVVKWKVPLVVMHMQGTPLDMQVDPRYPLGVTRTVREFFEERTGALQSWGVEGGRLILDPGIGFGKRVQDNLELIRNIDVLRALGYPVFIGLSRKGFIEKVLSTQPASPGEGSVARAAPRPQAPVDRDVGTVIANAFALVAGADMLRVHNVPYTAALVRMYLALRPGTGEPVTRSAPPRTGPATEG